MRTARFGAPFFLRKSERTSYKVLSAHLLSSSRFRIQQSRDFPTRCDRLPVFSAPQRRWCFAGVSQQSCRGFRSSRSTQRHHSAIAQRSFLSPSSNNRGGFYRLRCARELLGLFGPGKPRIWCTAC